MVIILKLSNEISNNRNFTLSNYIFVFNCSLGNENIFASNKPVTLKIFPDGCGSLIFFNLLYLKLKNWKIHFLGYVNVILDYVLLFEIVITCMVLSLRPQCNLNKRFYFGGWEIGKIDFHIYFSQAFSNVISSFGFIIFK